ncbi:alpha/beta hydrolase [Aquimarina spongiae]|uniref:Pimeloyl-ACP methyl ester carboxylesterase n=1 Tax=Aquimarina spongiae TaxID=570521 RepID=A0A1M6KJH1_9FLAO|nr:alpha/beta fold hydrolase [Aquimarina spongiae]SHJ58981.1 Pimeloyl-ACP methyl ester carboxylesterase [Aquimarina spongiae]
MREKFKKYVPLLIGKYLQLLFFFSPKKALHKAYMLFCTPRKGKVLPEQEDFLDEAEDAVIAVEDIYIQSYRWANMGETILVVHGWESNTHRWKRIIQKLHQQGYNVVAFDAPAHGYSSGKILSVPFYTQCLQKMVELYRPDHIMGHSVGGMTTLYHQYVYPDQEINKLIILAPPSDLERIMGQFQGILRLSSKFMKALDDFFKNKYGFYFEEFSVSKFATSIDKKGLLIHDKYDDIAPYNEVVAISQSWKGSQFITTENYGHSLFYEEVDDMIITFLKS